MRLRRSRWTATTSIPHALASATSWCVPATVPNYTSAAQTRCSPFAFACVRVVYVVAAVDAVSSHSVVPVWQVRITVITVWATVSTAHSGPSHCAALYIALWERTLQRTQCYRTSAAVPLPLSADGRADGLNRVNGVVYRSTLEYPRVSTRWPTGSEAALAAAKELSTLPH